MHGLPIKWNFMTDGSSDFSYFYTHRTNSVEQFGTSTLPWREKIPYCENVYKRLGTPAIFKISPLVSPDFDYTLENRGYEIQHTTDVMTLCLRDARLTAAFDDVQFTEAIPDSWIFSLFRNLKIMTNFPSQGRWFRPCTMQFPKETLCASVQKKRKKSSPPDLEYWIGIILGFMQFT